MKNRHILTSFVSSIPHTTVCCFRNIYNKNS